jgi:hypothetical protein
MDLLMEFCELQTNPTNENLKKFISNLKNEKNRNEQKEEKEEKIITKPRVILYLVHLLATINMNDIINKKWLQELYDIVNSNPTEENLIKFEKECYLKHTYYDNWLRNKMIK